MELFLIVAGVSTFFIIGGLIADHVLPRIKFLEKWAETLPMWGENYGD